MGSKKGEGGKEGKKIGLLPSFPPFAFLLPFSLRRRGLFNVYFCARSQLISSTNGDPISRLKIAEYFHQVNPLMIHRSAAFLIMLARHYARCYYSNVMTPEVTRKLTDLEAITAANLFLSDHMPDHCAGAPTYDDAAHLWRVAVLLTHPRAGLVGDVGEIAVGGSSEEILSHTHFDEMKASGRSLYEQHRDALEAAFWPTVTVGDSKTTAFEAESIAGGFLLDHLPDRFSTGAPRFDKAAGVWRVPVILAYPRIGSVGEVGELTIEDSTKEVMSHTPFEEVTTRALAIYEQRSEEIEAAFLQTRDC